jgi:arylsulfatase A-like enzyme
MTGKVPAFFSLLLIWLACGVVRGAARPNILFAIGDNWSYEHAGANGDPVVRTPVFDRIAREGARFTNAFCPVPSCSPTRSCILTGRAAHQLEDAASLWSRWPAKFRVFTDALRDAGYRTGFAGKGWSPGNHKDHGREENPAGPKFESFAEFITGHEGNAPFFFWMGDVSTSLHQWEKGAHREAGIDPAKVRVPAYLPDVTEIREEIADYLARVQVTDRAVGHALELLEDRGLLENTVVIHTSDNGWQMPHGLAHCYDAGTHVPLAIRWQGHIAAGGVVADFISLTDFAPTFLEIAGVRPWGEMTGRSFLDVLVGKPSAAARDHAFVERERHANVRRGDLSYPVRGVRTADFLYLRNQRPDRWPSGDPEVYFAVGDYGDVDGSRTKEFILANKDKPDIRPFFEMNFGKRPAEELYDLRTDPDQVRNLADDPSHAQNKAALSSKVDQWMKETNDPRTDAGYDAWDRYPYLGGKAKVLRDKVETGK